MNVPGVDAERTSGSVADFLAPVVARLSPILVPAKASEYLLSVAATIPAQLTDYVGIELHEGDIPDLYLRVFPSASALSILAGEESGSRLPDEWFLHPAWREVARFAGAWRKAPSGTFPHVFVGLDLVDRQNRSPLPFLQLRTDRLDASTLNGLLGQHLGNDLAERIRPGIARCLAHGVPAYLGVAYARSETRVRLTQVLPVEAGLHFLDGIGWPGIRRGAKCVLELAGEHTSAVALSLNVGMQVEPYLGVEILNWTRPVSDTAVWETFLTRLVQLGLVPDAVRSALLSSQFLVIDRQSSPEYRAIASRLHHVKIVLALDGSLSAKNYLHVLNRTIGDHI